MPFISFVLKKNPVQEVSLKNLYVLNPNFVVYTAQVVKRVHVLFIAEGQQKNNLTWLVK